MPKNDEEIENLIAGLGHGLHSMADPDLHKSIVRSAMRQLQFLKEERRCDNATIVALKETIASLEAANDRVCAGRSQMAYDQMIADGQSDDLLSLDDARRKAREVISQLDREPQHFGTPLSTLPKILGYEETGANQP